MRTYTVSIEGRTPMIVHADNIEWADRMEAWKRDPANRGKSKAGDDRTPPYRWLGSLYHHGGQITVPTENLMRSVMTGGALVPTGRGQKTFKAQTQSGIIAPDIHWPLLNRGAAVPTAPLFADFETRTWEQWNTLVESMGFQLFLKRARIGPAKHVRVRPKFDAWSLTGSLVVLDEAITETVLTQILEYAGRFGGLCEWRPGCRTPGPYGMYTATVRLLA